MLSDTNIVGLEILVPSIEDALTLFVDTLGFSLAHRGPAPNVSAETAVLDGGTIALTLIQPVESDGPAFPDPLPRLSQLIIAVENVPAASAVVARAGLPMQVVDESNAFVPPGAMEGVVGFPMALVLRAGGETGSTEATRVGATE